MGYLGYPGREAVAGGEALVWKGLMAFSLLSRLVRRLRGDSFTWVDVERLRDRMATGDAPLIIDVRGPDEFDGELGHLEGAANIPVAELPGRLGDLQRLKPREVVLVCRTQVRSARAAAALSAAGFRNVAVLRGGMVEWGRRQFPVGPEAARQVPQKVPSREG